MERVFFLWFCIFYLWLMCSYHLAGIKETGCGNWKISIKRHENFPCLLPLGKIVWCKIDSNPSPPWQQAYIVSSWCINFYPSWIISLTMKGSYQRNQIRSPKIIRNCLWIVWWSGLSVTCLMDGKFMKPFMELFKLHLRDRRGVD